MTDLNKLNEETNKRLLALIPYFHGVFARTKNPLALEIARDLGIAVKNTKKVEYTEVV